MAGEAAKKKRYRVIRGEPGCRLVTKFEDGSRVFGELSASASLAPPSSSTLPGIIPGQMDPRPGRASEECPWKKLRDRRIRPGQPCSDSFCPEQYCVRSVLRSDGAPGRRAGSQREPSGVAWKDPARLSCLTGAMESIERNRRWVPRFPQPIAANPSIPERRSQLVIRLRLLWLNFLLIPTRIGYMLRRKDRGSYPKTAITNQVEGQPRNWPPRKRRQEP